MTKDFAEGAPYWVDLSAPNVPAAARFYGELFGWQSFDLGEESGHYTVLSHQGKQFGAIGPCDQDSGPSWTMYLKVSDARATAAAVEAAGGTVRQPPMDVFDQCVLAQFTDPGGVDFAVSEPKEHKGAQIWNEMNTPGWVELHTRDLQQSLDFYKTAFGWTSHTSEMAPGMQYTTLNAVGDEFSFGGAFSIGEDEVVKAEQRWLLYFNVADCDKTVNDAVALGATVVNPPESIDRVGRFATLSDLNGAEFAIITPQP